LFIVTTIENRHNILYIKYTLYYIRGKSIAKKENRDTFLKRSQSWDSK
jgi:hypothetical protein